MKKSKEKIEIPEPQTVISNNCFTGVHWDAQALESVELIARGLLNLTELFKSQNIQIDTMLKVEPNNKKNKKQKLCIIQ